VMNSSLPWNSRGTDRFMATTGRAVSSLGSPGATLRVQDLAQQADRRMRVFERVALKRRCMPIKVHPWVGFRIP